jgi:hypothetical protein
MPDGSKPIHSINHAAARAYAADGWRVFPCRVDGKEPACAHGKDDATTGPAQIDRWWTENPEFNIGGIPPDGVAVVDVDVKPQKDGGPTGRETWISLVAEHGDVNATYRVKTPSGGWHVFFRGKLATTNGKIAPGIDTRGDDAKGYLLLTPSVVGGKPYVVHDAAATLADLPAWISVAVGTRRDKATREYVERSQKYPVPVETLVEILGLIDPSGAYDPWFKYIGAIRATPLAGVDDDQLDDALLEIAQAWSRGDYHGGRGVTGWESDDEVETKFWAMPPKPGGTTFGTLYDLAKAAGYTKPAPRPSAADVFAGCEMPELPDEPQDILGNLTIKPTLTLDMLPDAPGMAYAFDVAERQGSDPAATVGAMLATCAAAISDDIKIQRKEHDDEHIERAHFSALNGMSVGGGKTNAMRQMTKPLWGANARFATEHDRRMQDYKAAVEVHKAQTTEHKKHFAESSAPTRANVDQAMQDMPVEPVKPQKRVLIVNDATIEGVRDVLLDNRHGILNEQNEMIGFIGSWDAYRAGGAVGKDRGFWLQCDDGGPYQVTRTKKADGSGGTVTIPNLSCSFIGNIQLDKLRELAPTLHDDGFIQRGFVILTEGNRIEQDHEPNRDSKAAYYRLIDDLLKQGGGSEIKLGPAAHAHRKEVERAIDALTDLPTTPAAGAGHLRKWRGKFARTLLLFHVVECVSAGNPIAGNVSGATAFRCRRFMMRFLLPHQMNFYSTYFAKADARLTAARSVASYILARGAAEVTGRELQRECSMLAAAVHDAMATLQSIAWAGAPEQLPKGSVRWIIDPRVHVMFKEHAEVARVERAAIHARIMAARAEVARQRLDQEPVAFSDPEDF